MSTGQPLLPRRRGFPGAFRAWGLALLAALLAVALVAPGWAAGEPFRRVGQHPRALALGGTGVSYSNDETALYYNPAGLGSIGDWWVELLPLAVEASPRAAELAQRGELGTYDHPARLIAENIGEELYLRAFAYPTGVFNVAPGMTVGLGFFAETEARLLFRNPASPTAEASYRRDQGLNAAVSLPMAEGKVIWGLGVHGLRREIGAATLSTFELAQASAAGELDLTESLPLRSGSGVGYDLGVIWRMAAFSRLRAQFGLVVQNAGGMDLGEAGEIPQEVSAGLALRPRFFPRVPLLLAVEMRDLTFEGTEDDSLGKRTHAGLEVGLLPMDIATNLVTFRAGYGAGSPSAGIEFALWHFVSLQYAYYFEEQGTVAGEDPRPRQILQVTVGGF